MKFKVRKGDLVEVIAGKDKGKQGKIIEVFLKDNKVSVEGVNSVKRHKKASQAGQEGGILVKILPIHASNVMMVDPKTGKPTRIGKKKTKDGMVRFAKASGTEIKETKATV